MPAFVIAALNILGVTQAALPIIEKLLGGTTSFIAGAFKKLFGASAAVKLQDAVQEMEYIVGVVDKDLPAAVTFVKSTYADLDGLLAAEPWLAKMLHSTHQIQESQGVDRPTANKLNEAAHANIVVAKA